MRYKEYSVKLVMQKYSNGRIAIELVDHEGPVTRVTTNLPEDKLGENEIFVKNYMENEGMLEWLVENGIAEDTGRRVQSGFVQVPVMRLLKGEYD